MKKNIGLFLLLFFLTLNVWAKSQLTFIDKRIINIGDVKGGTLVHRKIKIKNDGDTPLILIKPIKSCNCTAVHFSREVINPRDTGMIEVEINTENKQGANVVTVIIVTNTEQQEHVLRISMNVIKRKVEESDE